jgi:hypothetical protein
LPDTFEINIIAGVGPEAGKDGVRAFIYFLFKCNTDYSANCHCFAS